MITDIALASEKRSEELLMEEIDKRLDLLLDNYQKVTANPRSMGYLRFLLRHYAKSPTPWRDCFHPDTPVDCPRDHEKYPDGIPISKLKSGDLVWSFNLKKKRYELKPVINVWVANKNAKIIEITLDRGRSLKVTKDHKFLDSNLRWRQISSFSIGDNLFSSFSSHSLPTTSFAIPISFLRSFGYKSSLFRPEMPFIANRRIFSSFNFSLFRIMLRKRIAYCFLSSYAHMWKENLHYWSGKMAIYSPLPSVGIIGNETSFDDSKKFIKRFPIFLNSHDNQSFSATSSFSVPCSSPSIVSKTSLPLHKASGPSKFGVCEITNIIHLDEPSDVWDIEVADNHNFAVLGSIAHNCYKDNLRRFGPEKTKGLCGVLKDTLRQTSYWRGKKGHSKVPDVGAPGVAIAYGDKDAANPPWHGNNLSELDMGTMAVPDEVCLIMEDLGKQCDPYRVLIGLDSSPFPSKELENLL